MSSPLLWFGNKARFLKSILQIPGSTSGSIDLAAPATPTPYQITLPPAQGTIGQVPTLDASLNLQWATPGSNPVTTFALTNNQVAPANVTGFLVNSATNTAFHAEVSVRQENNFSVAAGDVGLPNATFPTNAGTGIVGIVYDQAVQADGSVIMVGAFTSYDGVTVNNIIRVDSLGVLDTTFQTNVGTGPDSDIYCVRIQSSGKIVIGGNFNNFDGSAFNHLARLNTDGTLDASFMNTSGAFNGPVFAVNFLSATNNENIIVGGNFSSFTAEDLSSNGAPNVLGLSVNGKLIVPGIIFVPAGTGFNSQVRDIAVDLATDDVYAGGQFTQYDGNTAYKTVKLDSTGAIQSGFNSLGNINSFIAYRLRLQSTGELVVAGDIYRNLTDKINVFRYTSAGAADAGFNNAINTVASGADGMALAIQSDGKILVGTGSTQYGIRGIFRLNSTGAIDSTFSTNVGVGFNSSATVQTIELGADDVAYVGGQNMTTLAGSSIPANIIMLGEFASSGGAEYWLKTAIDGVYKPISADWEIAFDTGVVSSPAPGVAFTMLPSGQLQYTTTNLSGTIALNEMRFTIVGL